MRFEHVVTTEAQLREVIAPPSQRALDKSLPRLDAHCRAIIERSPFVVVASGSAHGVDASPKGDPAGFVQVLDDRTLAIPERPGNRRADTFRNVLRSPHVALLFLVPGRAETLRVNGSALLVRDAWLRERMAVGGNVPQLALAVAVEEAFVHCGKCALRSKLWDPPSWPRLDGLPSHAECLVDHARLPQSEADVATDLHEGYARRLY